MHSLEEEESGEPPATQLGDFTQRILIQQISADGYTIIYNGSKQCEYSRIRSTDEIASVICWNMSGWQYAW